MNDTLTKPETNKLYVRLISLWILSEAFLGGIVHGLKLPVSGLVVGGSAILCICFLGWFVPARGAILKATVVVAIFKMMLSPHSPPTAYIAVFFQGLMGEMLLRNRRLFPFLSILFAVLAMTESALQRILVLTVIYGKSLWEAVDQFVVKVTGQESLNQFSMGLAIGYVCLHLLVGIIIGWLAFRLIVWSEQWKLPDFRIEIPNGLTLQTERSSNSGARRFLKSGLVLIWVFLVTLYIQSILNPANPWFSGGVAMQIMMRSAFILLTWYLLLGPLLMSTLRGWLTKRESALAALVAEVMEVLPTMQFLVKESWKRSGVKSGLSRVGYFGKILAVNVLQ